MQLQSDGKRWAPKAEAHLEKANERAATHEVYCFDHATGRYEVKHTVIPRSMARFERQGFM
jgi:hypothetical protein